MRTITDYEAKRRLEAGLLFAMKPQLRFLWQDAEFLEQTRRALSEEWGIPVEWGVDGLCLQFSRRRAEDWWSLTVRSDFARLNYGGRIGLEQGVAFWKSQVIRSESGALYLPTDSWSTQKGTVVKKMKKMDMHIHTYGEISVDQMVKYMEEMMTVRGYCGLGFVACLRNSSGFHHDSNDVTMELKRRIPGSFAFAGLDHGKDYVEQAKQFMEQGFDGIKLLEGKPSLYRFWGTGYEGPRMDEFFAYAEEQQIPLVIHNNDPRANWDPSNPKADALREKGWYYGDGDLPSQEEFFRMLEQVFERHPNLRAAISHMGFYYDDLPRAARLLDACPNLYFDLTPAVEVFMELSLTPVETKAFFEKYRDRLFWGTDTTVNWAPDSRIRTFNDQKVRMMDVFFEGTEPETVAGKYPVVPIGFAPDIVEDIYYYNALRFMRRID